LIDLHTHSLLSDGALLPSELIRRAEVAGYRALAITDHADASNLEFVLQAARRACADACAHWSIRAIPGVELTHVPSECIARLTREARALGARIVVVHGETLVEPVPPGTNRAAIDAGVDILAHPGLISEEEVCRARDRGVCLEITTKSGHSLTNGYVASLARRCSAKLVLNTDSHRPGDLTPKPLAMRIARGAGLSAPEVEGMFRNSAELVDRAMSFS